MVMAGSILFPLCPAMLVGIFMSPARDRADMIWIAPGLWFWTIAFAVPPLAAVRQRVQDVRQFR